MNGTWWVNPRDLDDNQKEVVTIGLDGSYLVLGPPGSGKTNLLLLRANYLCRADRPNVLILVFTRTLREFLASGATGYAFSDRKISTYHRWGYGLLEEYGEEFVSEGSFSEQRTRLINQLQNLVEREGLRDLYDVILLDEAHDYTVEEIELFLRLGSNIFAVADPRQQIYDGTEEPIHRLRASVTATKELRYHYRTGLQICRLADGITKHTDRYFPLSTTANYRESDHPSSVRHMRCSTVAEQCERIIESLETQLQAYPDEPLGVICPRREELAIIRDHLCRWERASVCSFRESDSSRVSFDPDKQIYVCTLHSSKGLEFRALHFAAVDTLDKFPTKNRNMAFTGITRAKTSLSLYYSGDLYGYLESALASLTPRETLPSIEEAFGRGE